MKSSFTKCSPTSAPGSGMEKKDNISANAVIDNLARFIQVIGGDPELLKWFHSLERQTPIQRNNEILLMAEKMASQASYRDLATSLGLLSHQRIFDGLSQALRECGYIHD
jgi:hypothetical protein